MRPMSNAMLLAMILSPVLAASPAVDGERLPSLRVNGVRIDVTRLAEAGLAHRLQAIEAEWRKVGGELLPWRDVGVWQVLAHREGRWSDSLQVRRQGPPTEAWFSRMDLTQRPGPVPALPLPPGCRANSTVESIEQSTRVVQASGPCRSASDAETNAWLSGLASSGWRGGMPSAAGVWRWRRGAEALEVVRTPKGYTALQTMTGGARR